MISINDISRKRKLNRCGEDKWQKSYAALHASMLTKTDGRFIVAIPNRSGLADRIIGLVTIFMFGMIANRAFQVGNRKGLPYLETVFLSPHVNWSRPLDEDWLIDPLSFKAPVKTYNQSVLASGKYFGVNAIDAWKLQDHFLRHDILRIFDQKYETVLISLNRGKTLRIFENQHHSKYLQSTGLLPGTAFGCIVDFLFEPRPEIFAAVSKERRKLEESNTLKIGIQIRSGDANIMNSQHTINLDHYKAFFSCAQDIEDFAKKQGQSVIWFLVSDSMPLRRQAVEKYGSKIVTAVAENISIEHTSKESSVCARVKKGADCSTVSDAGVILAAAEWWLLGACDYFVISKNSGFGRSAAFRGFRENYIYTIAESKNGKEIPMVKCTNTSNTDWENLFYDWGGI